MGIKARKSKKANKKYVFYLVSFNFLLLEEIIESLREEARYKDVFQVQKINVGI